MWDPKQCPIFLSIQSTKFGLCSCSVIFIFHFIIFSYIFYFLPFIFSGFNLLFLVEFINHKMYKNKFPYGYGFSFSACVFIHDLFIIQSKLIFSFHCTFSLTVGFLKYDFLIPKCKTFLFCF